MKKKSSLSSLIQKQRSDLLSQAENSKFAKVLAVNKDLMKMTCFAPQPKILVIGLGPIGAYRIGLFKEYDTVSEDFLAINEFDLSKYDIVFVFGEVHYNEIVVKLNDYVQAGGNLALITTLLPQSPQPEYGRRDAKFLFEEHGYRTEHDMGGSVTIEVNKPNLLELEFIYVDPSFQSTTFHVTQDTSYFYPIGKYYLNSQEYTGGYPSFLYQENPSHGWILYNGYIRYEHSHEQAMIIWNTFFRAFALNLLKKPECISTEEQRGTLITPAKIEDNKILVGMVNNVDAKTFSYTLDLNRFGLSDGTYYVYLRENMELYGEFTSDQGKLSFPVDLVANDVKLFVVSEQTLGIDSDNILNKDFVLYQNYPNPFNPLTTIKYNLPQPARVRLKVYNIIGQEVRELLNEKKEAGCHVAKWDGTDSFGRPVAGGMYIYQVAAGDFIKARKMVLIR